MVDIHAFFYSSPGKSDDVFSFGIFNVVKIQVKILGTLIFSWLVAFCLTYVFMQRGSNPLKNGKSFNAKDDSCMMHILSAQSKHAFIKAQPGNISYVAGHLRLWF